MVATLAVSVFVALLVSWVVALVGNASSDTADTLESWDNGRAHVAGPLCAVLSCPAAPTTETHGWATCERHTPRMAA